MPTPARPTRRAALKGLAAAFAAPAVLRRHALAAPSETVRHASFGCSGMALADVQSLAASKHFKLVAAADVDLSRTGEIKKLFPDVKIYQDWRELLDKEKGLDSVNVSTPDHMHAPIAMSALQRGLHVYGQKPLTQTIYEARRLTEVAARSPKLVTQMGIQIHSHPVHRQVVAAIRSGAIGKVKEVHSWSGKDWGDRDPRPDRQDPVPDGLNWDGWLGVAGARPFLAGYYHPGNWRKRLDFGTGTFGDMGCHILDPVYEALALTAPKSVRSDGDVPGADSWGLDNRVHYVFPATPHTAEELSLHWYNGAHRPSDEVKALLGKHEMSGQGSVYIGTEGVLYSPYIDAPILLPEDKFKEVKLPEVAGADHYVQFLDACRGEGAASAPFAYAGPLTEMVLLGCLATRFPQTTLEWDAATLKVANVPEASALVRKKYRGGWEVEGL
ncbi:Gfo/Idh/MocA family protein [Paludisphaera mucosa]|uniref:Gfo/Idh/MocA family oxidoreductase n=1 Tax=Paludisphaera mucosa TaxID=3030827 RepID=A0ABT6FC48_9BACT|nr:Gfo/Idh/MocA family oxidoreductase [Paludisphaera mucosa]MDG3004960.1 Gfo/Idh/MocA family oxidoreductase [Paludisphaera mucosa]